MYEVYQPTTLTHSIIALVFYLVIAALVVYSFLAIYTLNKYGRSKLLAISVSLVFLLIMASLFAAAQTDLNQINF